MSTLSLPSPLSLPLSIASVEVGAVNFNIFDQSPDAPPVEIPFTAQINREAAAPGGSVSLRVTLSGIVTISRAEISSQAGKDYLALTQPEIAQAGGAVAFSKILPLFAQITQGDAP